ncbi:MAG: PAS domain S-box protein, partial [Promethearchaeota archaeon]
MMHENITKHKKANMELQLERENLITFLNSIEDGVYILNKDYNVEFANLSLVKEFGRYEGKKCYKYFADREEVCPQCEAQELQGETVRREQNSARNQKIYDIFKTSINNMDGSVSMLAIFRDITTRKKTEQMLKESEEKYRDLYESAPNAYFSIAPDKFIIRCNNAAVKLLGYSREELIGMKIFDIYSDSPEGLPKAKVVFKKFVEGIPIQDEELQMRHKDGTPIWVSLTVKAVQDQKGQVIVSRSMVIDITERKKAEQKVTESEEMYRNLFNSTPYAIWLVDLKGVILDCNEPMNKFLSIFKPSDLIGKPFREVLQMFYREGDPRFENIEQVLKKRFVVLLKEGYLKPIEFEVSRGDGKTFWITLESSFVNVGKNKLIQTFIKDITERKLAEIELDGLRKDLEIRIKERTIKLESSEIKYRKAYSRADCYKGLFTHDISNMFHTIGNSIELCEILLKEGIENNDMIEYFEVIEQQIKRGKKLINNIRNLSEIEGSEMPL